jgi:hypothetical protein
MLGGNVSHKVGDDSLGSPRKPNMKNATKQQPMERTISDKAGESSRTGCLPLGSIHLPPGLLSDVMEILPYSPVILRHPRKALFPGNGDIFFSVSGGYRDRHKAEKIDWSAKGEVILGIGNQKITTTPFLSKAFSFNTKRGAHDKEMDPALYPPWITPWVTILQTYSTRRTDMDQIVYNPQKGRLETIDLTFTDKNTTWFGNAEKHRGLRLIADYEGCLVIAEDTHSYPVLIYDQSRSAIKHDSKKARALLDLYR